MKVSVEFKGADKVQRTLRQLGNNAPKTMGKALYKEANDILRAAKILTPVDTSVLVNSGLVEPPAFSGNEVSVTIGFGGAASAYAEVQHEELSYKHKPPTQAKFLEQPFNEAVRSGIDARIALTLKQELL